MATHKELAFFLEKVERRAFKQALYSVRKEEIALDIVQDAMIKLSEKYGSKPAEELPLLFQRILQNTIHDHFRREKTHHSWISLFLDMGHSTSESENPDILESLEVQESGLFSGSDLDRIERTQTLNIIEKEVEKLPLRQREAFLMRYWEEVSLTDTAAIMDCSEGSVKTHCSRATHALAKALKEKGIKL